MIAQPQARFQGPVVSEVSANKGKRLAQLGCPAMVWPCPSLTHHCLAPASPTRYLRGNLFLENKPFPSLSRR